MTERISVLREDLNRLLTLAWSASTYVTDPYFSEALYNAVQAILLQQLIDESSHENLQLRSRVDHLHG